MSKYFTISEMCRSSKAKALGISNTPGLDEMNCLFRLIENILDPLREAYGYPITVTSGYRCPRLNRAVGGSPTSQHVLGLAADIKGRGGSREENRKLFDLIIRLGLPFDQLIDEYGFTWIHVSYSSRHRRQILRIFNRNGRKVTEVVSYPSVGDEPEEKQDPVPPSHLDEGIEEIEEVSEDTENDPLSKDYFANLQLPPSPFRFGK